MFASTPYCPFWFLIFFWMVFDFWLIKNSLGIANIVCPYFVFCYIFRFYGCIALIRVSSPVNVCYRVSPFLSHARLVSSELSTTKFAPRFSLAAKCLSFFLPGYTSIIYSKVKELNAVLPCFSLSSLMLFSHGIVKFWSSRIF
jgi:hypothetical protein